MKKVPKKKKDDEFKRLVTRNWIIFAVALMLILFFYFGVPVIQETIGGNG
jgi:hypothetical protein